MRSSRSAAPAAPAVGSSSTEAGGRSARAGTRRVRITFGSMESEADRLLPHRVFVAVELVEPRGDPVLELALERVRQGGLGLCKVAVLAGIGDEVIQLAVRVAVAVRLAGQDELVGLGADA